MIKQTHEEWLAELTSRFGSNKRKAAFICPACGHVATIQDHIDAGGDAGDAPQGCIGRTNGKGSRDGKDLGFGCNWAAYGFFGTLGKGRKVVFHDGHETEVFDFAPAEVLTNA